MAMRKHIRSPHTNPMGHPKPSHAWHARHTQGPPAGEWPFVKTCASCVSKLIVSKVALPVEALGAL